MGAWSRVAAAALLALAGCGGDGGGSGSADSADAATASDGMATDTAARPDADAGDSDDDAMTQACPPAGVDVSSIAISSAGRYQTLHALGGPGLLPRDVTVRLPASYDGDSARRYPVLYLHDGQNLFSAARAAFGVEWGVDETVDALVASGSIEEIIVVGVDNTDERLSDYSPTADPDHGGGNAPAYVDWLADELVPIIDTLYRTRCDPATNGVAGSSMGGLVSLYAMIVRPDAFGRFGVISPSLWWDGGALLDDLDAWTGPLPRRLWIDMGTEEGGTDGALPATVASVRRARDRALATGLTLGEGLGYLEDPGALHDEASWRSRLDVILRYLYGTRPLAEPNALTVGLYAPHLDLVARAASATRVEARALWDHVRLTVPNADAIWSVNGPAVRIEPDGTVAAEAPGAAIVSAAWRGLSASAEVTVAAGEELVSVTFVAQVPSSTPPGDSVYLCGDAGALGEWDPAALPMAALGDDVWSVTVDLPTGATVEYKFTRGSWATVESNEAGGDVGNRSYGPAAAGTVHHVVAGWLDG